MQCWIGATHTQRYANCPYKIEISSTLLSTRRRRKSKANREYFFLFALYLCGSIGLLDTFSHETQIDVLLGCFSQLHRIYLLSLKKYNYVLARRSCISGSLPYLLIILKQDRSNSQTEHTKLYYNVHFF